MSKKKEIKKIFENLDLEASDVHTKDTESAKEDTSREVPAQNSNVEKGGDEAAILRSEMLAVEQPGPEESQMEGQTGVSVEIPNFEIPETGQAEPARQEAEEENPDDILDDVRKSLLEESQEEQPKWWRRIGRSTHKKKEEEEEPV